MSLICFKGLGQEPIYSLGIWKFTDFSGKVKLNGQYRFQSINTDFIREERSSLLYSGGVQLNTKNYLWHPNFLFVEIGGEFNPESNNENYLVLPDRAEVRTMQKLDLRATLFKQRPITLVTYANFHKSNINRENLTSVLSNTKRWGSDLNFKNKILPFSLNYSWYEWDQEEIETGRIYQREKALFKGYFSKSFFQRDKHSFTYSKNYYTYNDFVSTSTENDISTLNLNNHIFFDKDKKYKFNSSIIQMDQKGISNYKRFSANEVIVCKLPQKLEFTGTYGLNKNQYTLTESNQTKIKGSLSHQLYLSLRTNIFYEYQNNLHSSFTETRQQAGIRLNYTKIIPTGKLNISYNYIKNRQNTEASDNLTQIINEEKSLNDGEIILLNNEHIDSETIIVKDATGTIIYSQDIDYIIIENNNFIEIQRLPGGQINNGDLVLVDYTVSESGSYNYDFNTNHISVSINLFKNFLEIYYTGGFQSYSNVDKSDWVTLNHYNQNIYGMRINYKFLRTGIEYDQYRSNIIPYNLFTAYINIQQNYRNFLFSINGNYKYYEMFGNETERRYLVINGNLVYRISPTTRIDWGIGYNSRVQTNNDLSIVTSKIEYTKEIRQLYLSAGIDVFHRLKEGEENKIRGVYLKAVRRF